MSRRVLMEGKDPGEVLSGDKDPGLSRRAAVRDAC